MIKDPEVKTINVVISLLMIIVIVLSIREIKRPTIDLPEEYELITPDTPIQGEFRNRTLTIEFKH